MNVDPLRVESGSECSLHSSAQTAPRQVQAQLRNFARPHLWQVLLKLRAQRRLDLRALLLSQQVQGPMNPFSKPPVNKNILTGKLFSLLKRESMECVDVLIAEKVTLRPIQCRTLLSTICRGHMTGLAMPWIQPRENG